MKSLRRLQLREALGDISIATVDRTIKNDPTFPKPFEIGTGTKRKARLWDAAEIEAWVRSKRKRAA